MHRKNLFYLFFEAKRYTVGFVDPKSKNYYAVILAGGGGTRLWPKSRQKTPKHLLDLFNTGPLIKLTYNRIEGILPKENIFIITHVNHLPLLKEILPDFPKENIISEPEAKNTAMAMGTAAAFIHHRNENASIIYLAADHIYKNLKKFQETALSALEVAQQGDHIVAIGIRPTFPHTGLGYIKVGEQRGEVKIDGKKIFTFKGDGFKEKPDSVTAQSFVASGQYLWNANLYCWTTSTIFNALEDYAPEIGEAVEEILEGIKKEESQKVLEKVYKSLKNPNSIDYEVSEKAKNIIVIPGEFGWSDIGDWKIVYDTHQKDISGNVIIDKATDYVGIDTRNCLVEANKKLIVTIGLEDLVIVDTPDALLICKKENSQDVKKAVEKLKAEGKEKYL